VVRSGDLSPDVTTMAMETRSKEHEMKQGPSRFRRAVTACAAGTIALSFLSVLGLAGTAGAAAGAGSAVTAATAPAIGTNGTNQPAGNLVITLAPGTTFAPSATITLTVLDNASGATIKFDHNPTLTVATGSGDVGLCSGGNTGCTITPTAAGTNMATIVLNGLGQATNSPTASTITLSNIGYTTVGAAPGYVLVSSAGVLVQAAAPSAANATVNSSALALLTAVPPSPLIAPGTTGAAGIWNLSLNGIGNQWVTGDQEFITVAHNDATNCETVAKPDTIAFSGTPILLGSASSGAATAVPTATATLAVATGSSCGVTNELVLTFTNSGTITTATPGSVNLAIVGVKYAVSSDTYPPPVTGYGTGTNLGPITVAAGYNTPPTFGTSGIATPPSVPNDVLQGGSNIPGPGGPLSTALIAAVAPGDTSITTAGDPGTIPAGTPLYLGTPGAATTEVVFTTAPAGPGVSGMTIAITAAVLAHSASDPVLPFGPSNATIGVSSLIIGSNVPSTTIQLNISSSGGEAVNQPVSPITITEGSPGSLKGGVVGWACIALSPGAAVGYAAEFATLPTVTATGGGIAVGNVSLLTPGSQTGPSELAFQVTTASSGTPGTVTVSGISLNVPNTFTAALNAELWSGANSVSDACTGANTGSSASGSGYAAPVTGAPYFPVASIVGRIWGQVQDATAAQVFEHNPPTCNSLPTGTPAVMVTNGSYQDALSASYLAGQLHTGILTTNTNSVSPEALRALAIDGVTQVFVVGGPLVVSPADITQLENTPAYTCGSNGVTPLLNSSSQVIDLTVQQIYGQTADDTAGAVATFSGAGLPGTGSFPAAYGGAYNCSACGSPGSPVSSAPDTNVSTAILATNQSFTDAASASAVAYTNHFPLLLTGQGTLSPAAAAALSNDSIQQVLVMGGPIAISDNVVNQVEAMGITVLRIAGQDFTDTSQRLARFELASTATLGGQRNGLDYDPFYLSIARGDYYTDAIVVSRMSVGAPILLTWDPNSTFMPGGTDYLGTFLTAAGQGTGLDVFAQDGTINNLLLVGGTLAISNPLATTLGHDLNG
jgi:putative cell wall-binding protein